MLTRVTVSLGLLGALVGQAAPAPLVIGHRGASGHRPEHTLEAYRLAIEMGADAIEPDLVSTRDGVLIARHEHEIGATTDVRQKFPSRRTTKTIDGQIVTGWFTEDFTLAEIRSLRAIERLPFRSHEFDGQFQVPTFEEVLALAADQGRAAGGAVIVYPELRHPAYFRSVDLPLEERLVEIARRHGLTSKTSPIFVQSFEPQSLQRLRSMTGVRLVQLLDQSADASPARLAAIARYADGIGPHKRLVVPETAEGLLGPPTSLIRDARAAGLFVHVWTLRSEPAFLAAAYAGDPAREVRQFAELGVDGIFTDFPDVAVAALK